MSEKIENPSVLIEDTSEARAVLQVAERIIKSSAKSHIQHLDKVILLNLLQSTFREEDIVIENLIDVDQLWEIMMQEESQISSQRSFWS